MLLCSKVRIEVPFFIFTFALIFGDSITTNWIIFRTCYVTLGYNRSECALLGSTHSDNSTAKLEEIVQPHASIILMTKLFIGAFGTPIICFFLGPWSDKYGRKPVFLLTIAGTILQYLILAIICEIPNLSPWFILLSIIPLFFTGGFMALLAAILCYINDITANENRGTRIAVFYGVLSVGFLLASLSSSYALRMLGYFVMYLTASCLLILTWLIILLFIEESVPNPEREDKYSSLFQLSLVQETVKTTFKRRDNYERLLLLLLLLLLLIYVLSDNASSVMFLYVREKFHWSLETYTIYNSIITLAGTIGCVVGVYFFHKLLKINESFVIMIGFVSIIGGSILCGVANKNWHIYAAGGISCLYGTISPMARSLISKLVSADEYGKVFSFLAVCESFLSPIGSPLFIYIYNHTLSTFPGAFSLVAAGISIFGMIFCILVISIQRFTQTQSPYSMLNS